MFAVSEQMCYPWRGIKKEPDAFVEERIVLTFGSRCFLSMFEIVEEPNSQL